MRRVAPKILHALVSLPCFLVMAGCSHPCGYVDIRSTLTPLNPGERQARAADAELLRVTRAISAENAVPEARIETREVAGEVMRQDTYGRPTYVKYAWYTPILKPFAAVTIIAPFYMSFHDPHVHNGGSWRKLDFFRDVLAWYNLFSAMPTGPREMGQEEVRISSKKVLVPPSECGAF